jgi:hypothetical protein
MGELVFFSKAMASQRPCLFRATNPAMMQLQLAGFAPLITLDKLPVKLHRAAEA